MKFHLFSLLPVLLLAGCAGVTPAARPATGSAFEQAWQARQAELPRLKHQNRVYAWQSIDGGFWLLPVDYELGGRPEGAGGFPDDERCFEGTYSEDWVPYAVPAWLELRDFLAARGIDFAVALYPDPWEISARVLNPEFRDEPTFAERAAERLRREGLTVFCAARAMAEEPGRAPFCFYYDRFDDLHPDVGAVTAATGEVAAWLSAKVAPDPAQHFSLETAPTPVVRLHPVTGERLWVEHVLFDDEVPRLRHPASPVLVIGNSISATPYAGEFAARLGMECGVMCDYLRNDGDGVASAMPRRLLEKDADYLHGKRAVVLVASYPQLFYRWQSIALAQRLMTAHSVVERIAPEAWPVTEEVNAPDDGWWACFSRSWRRAEMMSLDERAVIRDWRKRLETLTAFKSGAPCEVRRFAPVALKPGRGRVLKLAVFTTAPPGYLKLRAGDYETALADYTETLLIPVPDDLPGDRLAVSVESVLPEQLYALGELSVIASSETSTR